MFIWRTLKQLWMGSRQSRREYSHTLEDVHLLQSTNRAANPVHDPNTDERYLRWTSLSPREQDVTALACLRYTNPQIAARLGLSAATVRSYLEKVFNKLGLQSKADLRVFFAAWDFSEFERQQDPHR